MMAPIRYSLSIIGIMVVLTDQVQCFQNSHHDELTQRQRHLGTTTSLQMVPPPDAPAGSFFNPVPENDDDDNNDKSEQKLEKEEPKDIDDQIVDLLRQRRKPSRASRPSTIDGVPTAKASGFGKPKGPMKPPSSKKPFIAIGEPDKPLNDPSNPEYDDQGYTLYADEKTGEKSRVFEALVDYPCQFTLKIVGANEGSFVSDIVALVAEACETEIGNVPHTTRAVGKWTSVTVKAPVKDAEMLYTLYEKVDLDPRVKFKF